MNHILKDEFNDFYEKIQLLKKQSDRINSAIGSLSNYLIEQYDLKQTDIYLQGSFSTNTAVRPSPSLGDNAEYDVDLIVLCANDDISTNEALDNLEDIIQANGIYKDKIEKENPNIPCVRLRYADEDSARFHVDLVPSKNNEDGTISIPRRDSDWEVSRPKEYTEWVKSLGARFQRTVMLLKRWRDENKIQIKSIVLQVIVANCISGSPDDSVNLMETFQGIKDFIEGYTSAPELSNPVLENETITENWKDSDFTKFKELINEAVDISTDASNETEHDESAALWQKILGDDFIYQTDKEVSLGKSLSSLGDTKHAEPLHYQYQQTEGVKVEISALFSRKRTKTVYRRKQGTIQISLPKYRIIIKSEQTLLSGGDLEFTANVSGLKNQHYEIHWQVVNTGEEALRADGLRGNFFVSRDQDHPKHNHENTQYQGTHWIECFIIMNNICVARSGRFYVNIVH